MRAMIFAPQRHRPNLVQLEIWGLCAGGAAQLY